MRVMELSRKTSNEAHSFIEFIRFEEIKGNVLYSRIEPKCDVLSQVYASFSELDFLTRTGLYMTREE